MMVFFGALRCVLLLWNLYPVCYSAIDNETVARAKAGEWVGLPGSKDETLFKVAKQSDGGDSFNKAEEFCKKHDSHLTSILSDEEEKFIAGFQNHF
ncbi:hypothetical protein OSTOST_03409 [Ostertagia ostertagi]